MSKPDGGGSFKKSRLLVMFHRIQDYELIEAAGLWYRPRAYGDPQPDGMWDGWLVFFPLHRGIAIAPPGPETTQSTAAALAGWASGLGPVYLEGALARALHLAERPPLIARLTDAEYEALDDSVQAEATPRGPKRGRGSKKKSPRKE